MTRAETPNLTTDNTDLHGPKKSNEFVNPWMEGVLKS
jgi:hypothetical protein